MGWEESWRYRGCAMHAFRASARSSSDNFAERGEVGASVCVMIEGRIVVDLWGGLADRHTGRPWERDTIGLVWSSTKGATALCAHMLCSRGLLDLDRPVASYWPEFGQAGKDSHHRPHVARSSGGTAGHPSAARAGRAVRLAIHDRRARRRGAVLGAGHAAGLSCDDVRPSRRRSGAARVRPAVRRVFPRGSGGTARTRFPHRFAGRTRAARGADHPRRSAAAGRAAFALSRRSWPAIQRAFRR